MTSKNNIRYDYKKAIKQNGKITGWHLYTHNGLLGAGRFAGYLWRTKSGNAGVK